MNHWTREGNLLYTLKHAGWRKGQEQFQNETTVRIDGDNAEDVLEFVWFCLRNRFEIEEGRK